MRSSIVLLFGYALLARAAVVTLDWNVTWVWAAPDGYGRPVIGINNQWPPPPIHVNLKDQLIIHLTNGLGNETTALHYHGQNQGKSSQMEGAAAVTQCALPPGMTMTYNFTCGNTGTHWYHSHIGGSYLDGFRGPLIVHDAAAPYMNKFDEEIVMTVSDWYHKEAPYLLNSYQTLKKKTPSAAEPVPDSTLMNDQKSVKFDFVPGKRYLFRIINMSGFANHLIYFEGHNMTIVEMDGVATAFTNTSRIKIAASQRYNVIVTALPAGSAGAKKNYGIVSVMDPGMWVGDIIPEGYKGMTYSYIVYNRNASLPERPSAITDYSAINEIDVRPFDQQAILGPVTQLVVTNFDFTFIDGISRGTMNGTTYLPQVVPTLYTALSAPAQYVTDPRIYGSTSNTVIFNNPVGIAEIVVNNFDNASHPFHIHGHIAQIVAQGPPGKPGQQSQFNGTYMQVPTRRDVFMVNANSFTTVRFKTGNPGIWLLHCHIEWHIEAGLGMTFVEDPIQLQAQNLFIPQDMYDACAAQGIPTIGNAGGDSVDWLNLTNAPTHPPQTIWGALVTPPGSPVCNNTLHEGSGLKNGNYTTQGNGGSNGNGNYGNANNGNYQKYGCQSNGNNAKNNNGTNGKDNNSTNGKDGNANSNKVSSTTVSKVSQTVKAKCTATKGCDK